MVETVGEDNVVQVVTYNDASYKAAGGWGDVIEKRKKLFWTPCAPHCLHLILEDFKKKLKTHRVTTNKK